MNMDVTLEKVHHWCSCLTFHRMIKETQRVCTELCGAGKGQQDFPRPHHRRERFLGESSY